MISLLNLLILILISSVPLSKYYLQNQPAPSKTDTNILTPSPDNPIKIKDQYIENFYYPDSEKESWSDNLGILKSSDEIEVIQKWYLDKLKNFKFNSISKTNTNSNGIIFSRYKAQNGNHSIQITIFNDTKKIVKITIEVT